MCIGNEEKYQSCQSQKIILNNFDFEQYFKREKLFQSTGELT